jgi:DNA-binding beta-propeller fold protein YncE
MMRECLLLLLCAATLPGAQRLLYVADKTSGISVYDIDHGHKFIRKIEVPDSGDYKGIMVSPPLGRLYLTSYKRDELIAIDLATDKVVWRKKHGGYADSGMVTPDGKRLYIPYRDGDDWKVIDAASGDVLASIKTEHGQNYTDRPIGGVGPHNTWINPSGTRVYMSILTVPWIYVADTATNQVIGKIGPFGKGIRPFALRDDEKYLYANVDALLGFETAEIQKGAQYSGKVVERVEARTPAKRLDELRNPPAKKPHSTESHGINIRPDQKEVWVVDGIYGYVYAYDVTRVPAKQVGAVPLYTEPSQQVRPGWISFSLDGKYAYPDGGCVIDTHTKKVVARISTSEKLLEIDFEGTKVLRAGHR